MIGVIAKGSEEELIKEFFELFKTPWELYRNGCSYDIIITTGEQAKEADAQLVIIYSSEKTEFDHENRIEIISRKDAATLEYDKDYIPIYAGVSIFEAAAKPLISLKGSAEAAGIEIKQDDKKVLRIGYDIFEEVRLLLACGQPERHALVPTIDMHISILRDLLLSSGAMLVEMPPVPAGHPFFSCITHDIDFLGIRHHRLDRTFFGFIFRGLFTSVLGLFGAKGSLTKLLRSIKAVVTLPAVYAGLLPDFWFQLDRYMEIEKGLSSTYYFIPFKRRPGKVDPAGKRPPWIRSAKYDMNDYRSSIERLAKGGFEVGLHGIDAWHDTAMGRDELEALRAITGDDEPGVRMHWLYFSEESPGVLSEAGFMYDSTLGYNGAVGYRSGTTQVFRSLRDSAIFELPMNVMDSAMFYPNRMDLAEIEALSLCKSLIEKNIRYGGVFTVNWHQRSIAPERCWDDFYHRLLGELKSLNARFITAKEAVKWFKVRRSVRFGEISSSDGTLKIRLDAPHPGGLPPMLIRVHDPRGGSFKPYTDMEWNGEPEIEYVG